MRISDWSSDVCSSDLGGSLVSLLTLASWGLVNLHVQAAGLDADVFVADSEVRYLAPLFADLRAQARIAEGESWERFVATLRERGRARTTLRSEEHTSELQSLMRMSYAGFCLKKKKKQNRNTTT